MANTYYDSELTSEEIEEVLEAINGILTQANNGKVLAISNGKFEARSVQWGGGGSAVLEPLSVTQNGIYNPPSGVDGYAPVTVNVSGGGGSEPSLPAEYQQVEYISVVPYQYISVPIATTPLVGRYVSAKVMQSPSSDASEAGFWGSNSSGAAEMYFKNDLIQPYDGAGWSYALIGRSAVSSRGNVCYIKVFIRSYANNHFKFGQYRDGSYPFTGNLYELLVYSNSGFDTEVTVETRLIPCYRKIDSVAGMYDIYRNVFYTNQGSGSFGVGPDVN